MKNTAMLLSLYCFLSACAQKIPESVPVSAHLQKLFDHGRMHRFWPWQNQASLSLLSNPSEISAVQQLGDSPYAAWIRFDADVMLDLAEDQLALQLPSLARRYGSLLGELNAAEWQLLAGEPKRDENRLSYSYQRKVLGLEVRDNILQLIFCRQSSGFFRLIEIVSNTAGPSPKNLSLPAMTIDKEWLVDLTGEADLSVQNVSQEWIPFLLNGTFEWHSALVFDWLMDGQAFRASLATEDHTWLDAYPLNIHAKPLMTRALKRSYAEDGAREYPLSFAEVKGSGGDFDLDAEAWLPEGFVPSQVGLNGSRAMVFDMQTPNQLSYAGLQEQDQSFLLQDDSSRLAAVNAFVAVQRINRYVRQFLSPEEAPFLNQTLLVNVNIIDKSCNAYYSPKQQRILLYKEGDGCANMALINDVIYHEWGHALDDHIGRATGIVDAAFSEGLADVVAAYFNGDSAIAPYFVFDDPNPIRNIVSDRSYPRDTGQMHFEGGIISGSFWDLRQLLIERYGSTRGAYLASKYFFRHLLTVDSYLESYAAVLRLDDDDGNPATPSPNHCLINAAFAKHGLAPEESCLDAPVPSPSPVNQGISAALLDAGPEANAVHLLSSAPVASAMFFCWGTQLSCLGDRSSWVQLDRIGALPERVFFRSTKPVLLSDLASLMLYTLDEAGQISGSREIKVFAK